MTQKTAAIEADATRRPFNTDLREFPRDSVAGEDKFPLRLSDFKNGIDVSGRSKADWARAHDRAIGVVIGIASTGAVWAAWAIVTTH